MNHGWQNHLVDTQAYQIPEVEDGKLGRALDHTEANQGGLRAGGKEMETQTEDKVAVKLLEVLAAQMEEKSKETAQIADAGERPSGELQYYTGLSFAYAHAKRKVRDTIKAYRIACSG